jgi:hypothetical protein
MARARNIKPSFFTNDTLAECEPLARLLFVGLWTIADRSGRLEDRPKKIKAEVLPYDNCDCEKLLSKLHNLGFILRYKVQNVSYIQIINFEKHQNPHIKESASTIPEPDLHYTNTILATPLTDSLLPLTDSLLPIAKSKKVSLDELSVNHISEWLNKKRALGKYLAHDEFAILERFKDYCLSKGKKYDDYIAAYRNAFEWDSFQPKKPTRQDPAATAFDSAQDIIARRNAENQRRMAESANHATSTDLCLPENLRRQGSDDGFS